MNVPAPHFQLYSLARAFGPAGHAALSNPAGGTWQFVLKGDDGHVAAEAADEEPDLPGDRLELLAIVRGLEALDQPSRVTLFTESRYVSRGIRFGLESWRENDWEWECYGQMIPVKNRDLWQRIDQAMRIHQVECRTPRYDAADDLGQPDVSVGELPIPERTGAAESPRRVRLKGRELRIDRGSGNSRGARPARKTPAPGFVGYFSSALTRVRRLFQVDRPRDD